MDEQEDYLDWTQNGTEIPEGVASLRDLDLIGHGQFHGIGQRVGEAGEGAVNNIPERAQREQKVRERLNEEDTIAQHHPVVVWVADRPFD